jgi:adenine-specific DNA-methyltransferase
MDVTQGVDDLLRVVEERRRVVSSEIDAAERARLGQFFTPTRIAQFIASLPTLPESGRVRILDPGAGNGSLTAALVARIVTERPDLEVAVTAFEIDKTLCPELEMTLNRCHQLAKIARCRMTSHLLAEDFLEWGAAAFSLPRTCDDPALFDVVIMNPPYRKVNVTASERLALQRINVEVTNLYVAFLAMSVALLDGDGQLAAITPRSFTNGPYFRSFRQYFFDNMTFDRLHLYESRSKAFAEDAVLQENIIFHAHRRGRGEDVPLVTISTSKGPIDKPKTREVLHSEIVSPDDPERFVHIMTDDADAELGRLLVTLPNRISTLGIGVSTGRVVDFRAKDHLRFEPQPGTIPLIYPGHLREGRIAWPGNLRKKPSWIVDCEATDPLFLPSATYVVVKRFTAKEERRRVVASVFDPADVPADVVAFENHLNVFHDNGHGLPPSIADGLATWLNSTIIDRFVRCFNGHTQINATDLRRLPYPSTEELQRLGAALRASTSTDQESVDALVACHVKELRGLVAA